MFQKAAQNIRRKEGFPLRDHVGHQPLFSRSVLLSQDDSFSNGRVLGKGCLDFRGLDTEPANLHLLINTAQKFDIPIRQVTGAVAGLVQPRSALGAKGVWNELLSGQIRSVRITPGQAGSADVQLAGNSNWDKAAVFVENVCPPVAEGPANRGSLKAVVGSIPG